LKNPD